MFKLLGHNHAELALCFRRPWKCKQSESRVAYNRQLEKRNEYQTLVLNDLATRWLSPFSGVARACAHAHIIFTAVSKREAVRYDAMFLLTKVMYSLRWFQQASYFSNALLKVK